jgi:hypothetical protein
MTVLRHPGPGHEVYEELAAGSILRSLEPIDETRFQDHLGTCAGCQAAVADYAADLAEAALVATPAEKRTDDDVVRDVAVAGALARVRRWRPAYRWLAGVTAAVVVALGAGNLALYQRQQEIWHDLVSERAAGARAVQIAETRSAVIRMLARPGIKVVTLTNSAGQGQGAVMVEPDGAVHLVSDGLGRNRSGENTYVLWRIVNGSPMPVSAFDIAGPSIALHDQWQLPRDGNLVGSFAVSLEPGRQMPAKPSGVVARGSVRG